VDGEEPPLLVEEAEVEREAHAKGVDAGAAWDEKPGADLGAIEPGEPEQATAGPGRDPDLAAEHGRDREASQARCETSVRHSHLKGAKGRVSPPL